MRRTRALQSLYYLHIAYLIVVHAILSYTLAIYERKKPN